MKKVIIFLCMITIVIASTVISSADTNLNNQLDNGNEVITSINFKDLEKDGWKMVPVSEEEVAAAIIKNTNCTFEAAMEQVRQAKATRLVVDNHMLYKDYKVTMDKSGAYVGTYRHYVMVTASGTGNLKWIEKVYTNSVSVLAKTGKFSWESGSNYINSWSRNSIKFTSVGNAVLTTSTSIGATVAGVGVSVSGNYYYRFQKTFNTNIVMG